MRPVAALLAACLCQAVEPGNDPAAPLVPEGPTGIGAVPIGEDDDRERGLDLAAGMAWSRLGRAIRSRGAALQDRQLTAITGATDARFDLVYAEDCVDVAGIGPCMQVATLRDDGGWDLVPIGVDGIHGTLSFDATARTAFAMWQSDPAKLADHLRQRAGSSLAALADAVEQAQGDEDIRPRHDLMEQWLRCLAGLRAAGDDLAVAHGLATDPADADLAARLAALHQRSAVALLRLGRPVASIDDLADALATQLGSAAGGFKPLAVVPIFTVRDSQASSALGRRLATELTAHLPTTAGWRTSKASVAGLARDTVGAAGAEVVILGTIWDGPDGAARCVAAAYRLDDGRMIAAAEAVLPAAALTGSGLAAMPENIERIQAGFRTTASGDPVSAWTSHGDDAPVYAAGESIEVTVRFAEACHLRIIRTAADGRRDLLVDDQALDQAQARRGWQLPEGLPVAAPFGIEVLHIEVAAKPFPALAVHDQDGRRILDAPAAGRSDAATRLVITTIEQ